ncbi:GntR family transcriptional regulator [Ancylobacter sp. MQZ15Z-1]|uniref:GntR family transcriptional regulator n=1 Tax=Ancylobacter mangrovi TaxID=2972472 RepID=A0A9X2P9W7_9HYPH|nr:GntR family transcriptional regulator [Ancylobacter mangrovi]MCS0494741.1 GntR family transcriptional regulator [Ancylobacter mangrovi]
MADQLTVVRALRRRITSGKYPGQSKLPPERMLAEELEVSRGTLRKALNVLESEGLIWRHVGKGTFVGHPSVRVPLAFELSTLSISPRELLEARLMFEPIIAARAAHSATHADIQYIRKCVTKAHHASNWENFELWDRTLHRAIAAATQNSACVMFLDIVNKARENDDWSRTQLPPLGSNIPVRSRAIHFDILEAITRRNASAAARAMKLHLERVRDVYFRDELNADNFL